MDDTERRNIQRSGVEELCGVFSRKEIYILQHRMKTFIDFAQAPVVFLAVYGRRGWEGWLKYRFVSPSQFSPLPLVSPSLFYPVQNDQPVQ
jgi:hypothetical protein